VPTGSSHPAPPPQQMIAMANLRGSKRIKWTDWDAFLGKVSDKELASRIGCVPSAVTQRRNRLGVQPALHAGWTEDDQRFVDGGVQQCSVCGQVSPFSGFNLSRSNRYGRRRECRICQAARERAYDAGLKREWVNRFGGGCQNCGFGEWLAPLDFHHVNGDSEHVPSRLISRRSHCDKAESELDKCCLLCANCHRAYHAGEVQLAFVKREGLGWTVKK
jgi:hypothetical protein